MKFKKYLIFLPALIFLVVGIITLKDYGLNTDEPFHFNRGQAYFHFFQTGNKDFKDEKMYPRLGAVKCIPSATDECSSPPFPDDTSEYVSSGFTYEDAVREKFASGAWGQKRSYFESDALTFNEVIKEENGHPPFGGIFASLTNFIFYQKLGIVGDIESYHLAEIIIATLGILAVSVFCYLNFGVFVSLTASSAAALYPLFFSESHFNIKDPIESSLIAITTVLLYFSVTKKRFYLALAAAVTAGFALGTKFNIVFLPVIVGPWFISEIVGFIKNKEKIDRKVVFLLVSLVVFPIITLFVFYALWPYLWPDPLKNIQATIGFYKTIGTGTPPELSAFLFKKFNLFPAVWIFITTPVVTLILAAVGLIASVFEYIRTKKSVYVLLFFWLFVPIIRVSLPGSAIYGGVRQILEFLFPMAIFAGIGLSKLFKRFRLLALFVAVILMAYPIIKYHPNENVYFNALVGGLSGAKVAGIPYWGNTYGNVYFQGVNWLNKNAEPGARIGLPIGTMANIPRLKLRSDIKFNNGYWSGPARGGEYEMEQVYDYPQLAWYSYQYYDTYLNPVYEVKVDGVTLLKVWKNDLAHTKKGFETEITYPFKIISNKNGILNLDFGKTIALTRLVINHTSLSCDKQKGGSVSTSMDGTHWVGESETIDYPQVPPTAVGWTDNNFVFLFAARKARYLKLNTDLVNPCLLQSPEIEIRGLKE